ncbi:MAG TPA: alpha-2-macroglobulin family protein, partial [Gemmata sp.]|nr:alpha-2-macroglobulin family protein [Gemmata sp.]
LHPEWLKGNHTITISGVFTDETGRENRSNNSFNLTPNPTRGMRVTTQKELFTTGEKIPVTLSPFGLAANDKPATTLVVVRLEAQPATPGSESSGDAFLDNMRLSALGQNQDAPKKTKTIDDWKSVPVFDPIKRILHELVPVANDTAQVTLRRPGAYKLLAITKLADGSTLQAETGLVVKTPAKLSGLVLQLDKREIDAGSRLTGTVHTRFAGAKLLLTLRDSTGIKLMRPLTAGANGIVRIDEPLPANLRYGCAVCVQYPESQTIIHAEQRELFVIPTDRMIRVTTTVPAEVGPGADINLGVQIDRQEETDLIVSVFDESLLGVSGDLSKDIRNFYLGDTRGQVRAARDLATTRFGSVTIESLIAKGVKLLADKNALSRELALEYHLRGLIDRWKNPGHNLLLTDVVTLVRLAGLEVYLAVPYYFNLGMQISVPQNATLADVLRWERKTTNNPEQKGRISATVIGNVALISAVDWAILGKTAEFTNVPDPWAIYRATVSGYTHPGLGLGFAQFGQPGGISMTGFQQGQFGFNQIGSYPNGFGSMTGFPYGQNGYYNQFGLGGMIGMGGMMGMGSGMMGMGGMMGMRGGMAGIPGAQGIPNYPGAFAPGGQMGMSYGFNRDFGPQIGVDAPAPLPALGLADDVVRRDFADSAFWSASVRTDKTGKATATFKLPDSLTNWRVAVTAVSSRMHVGTGIARFKSTRSVMIWPMLPRTFTEGDVVRVFGTVHNLTDKEQAIQVHLKAENGQVMGGADQSVNVPAKGSVPVYWTYKAGTKGWTDLLMSAKCEAGSDASLKHLPIAASGILERETASGLIGKGDLKIVLPADFDPARASVTVTIAPTLAADLADTLPYLVDYPYGCVEQTMSRFLPAIRVAQILRQSGVSTLKDLELKLPKVVEVGQKRLIELQQSDGGWGWQGSGTTHEMMTPYALFGLIQAEEAGYPCPNPTAIPRGMDRLLMYLDQMAATAWDHGIITRQQHRGEINDSLFCLWVYAMKGEKLDLTRWWNRIETNIGEDFISDYGHALALELAANKGKKELADKLAAELHKRAKKSGDRIYWTTAGFSRWGENVTEITAAVMKALVAHDPNDSLIPGVLAFFHGTKRGNHWDSTKDTACVLYALCDYLAAVRAGPAAAGLVKISINGIDDGNVRLDAPTSKTAKLTGKALKPGENLFTITGPDTSGGAMVRVVVEFTRGRTAEIPARDHGVKVGRTVSLRGVDGTWSELKSGATVPAGSYLKIRVSATPGAGTNLQYTVLESPKPAGGETVPVSDTRFPTPADSKSHVLREDREAMTCFHYEQAAGMVAAEYVVLTEFAGEFRIAPARVELMYKPTVGGHSASFVV